MDRIDIAIKTGVGFLAGIVSIMTGLFGVFVTVLLFLMLADFITGLLAGAVTTGLSSKVGRIGFVRKLYIIILLGSVYAIETQILGLNGSVTEGIAGMYCFIEIVSIIENGGRLGVPIPDKLKNLIAVMKNKIDQDNK